MTSTTSSSSASDPTTTTSTSTASPSAHDVVESPSLSCGNALARFEFEPGCSSNDGTKILMVEWEEDESTASIAADWEISWDGKKRSVLPARDAPPQTQPQPTTPSAGAIPSEETHINRLYFLLGPGIPIPPSLILTKGPTILWRTHPLPAIFSPDMGFTARQAGKKGVLHTIWAKKRLQSLREEIAREERDNAEGVGLSIAVAELEWIEGHFGVSARPGAGGATVRPQQSVGGGVGSPTSPSAGRMAEKLKGLKLGTSETDLSPAPFPPSTSTYNPLSPEGTDVAVGSFGSFATLKGMPPSSSVLAAKVPQPAAAPPRRVVAHSPPESFAPQSRQQVEMGSLNALASSTGDLDAAEGDAEGQEDDLFALPMSPRSPDMAKGPFSFARDDTERYLKG